MLSGESRGLLLALANFVSHTGGTYSALKAVSAIAEPLFAQSIDQLWRLSFVETDKGAADYVTGGLDEKRYALHPLTRYFVLSEIVRSDDSL
ncbi:MAG: hypothetical protein R2873_19370 [Caldilineaceae bacterium]